MTTLGVVLGDDSLDGLYQWPGTSVPASLLASARNQGWTVGVAQLGAAHTKADTLKALQRDLEFPEWFGQNWDALADSLFEWSTSARCLLVLEDIRADHDTVETLLTIVETLSMAASAGDRCVVVVTAPKALDGAAPLTLA